MRSHFPRLIWATLILSLAPAFGTTLFTNSFVPLTYDPQVANAWSLDPNGISSVAILFTPTDTLPVTEIDLPLAVVSGNGGVVVSLVTDLSGSPPSVLESWTPTIGSTASVITLASLLHPTLVQGTGYYLMVTTTDSLSVNWFTNGTNTRGAMLAIAGNWYSSANAMAPAAAVFSEVPEPSTVILMSLGIGLLAAARSRRRHHE